MATQHIFLLTHPVWDVTSVFDEVKTKIGISTHTSRVGCDYRFVQPYHMHQAISTHTSRVGCDPIPAYQTCSPYEFLLTHPVWDVTPIHKFC